MQKISLTIFTLLGSFLSPCAASAQTQPTLYGQFNLGILNTSDQEGGRDWQLENHASRLGIKGSLALENDLSLIYQYEVGINPTRDDKPVFSQRNTFVGLESPYGQLIIGTFDTPLKSVQDKIDLFNDSAMDMSGLMAGEVRHENSVQYSTPTFLERFRASVDWLPGVDSTTEDGLSAAIHYRTPRVYVAAAMDRKVGGDAGIAMTKKTLLNNVRLGLAYQALDAVQLGVVLQQSDGAGTDESKEKIWLVSAQWSLDRLTLKAQTGRGNVHTGASGIASGLSLNQTTLGIDYSLAKQLLAYAYLGQTRGKETSQAIHHHGLGGIGLKYTF